MEPAGVESDLARAAIELLDGHATALRRAARRLSLCDADADDALQRSFEILLTKGLAVEPAHLAAWMRTVTRHEALAVRRNRERLLGPPPLEQPHRAEPDGVERLVSEAPDPLERLLRDERVAEGLDAVARLKASERLAILLQAEGYSYAEICHLCGWTYTKVNRSLAEGRAALRERSAAALGE